MTTIICITMIASLAAMLYFYVLRGDNFFGTIVPVIVSTIIGVIWTAFAIVIICTGNLKAGLYTLVIGFGMFARAYIDFQTYRDAQEIFARWGRRG